jgi:type II secretory pathway predicted ATPase ExeA
VDLRLWLANVGQSSQICRLTGGIPRLINTVCDRALVHGYGLDLDVIGLETVIAVREEISASGLNLLNSVA